MPWGPTLGRECATAGTCGALSGALLVLGAMGFSEEEAAAFIQQFQKRRGDTALRCADQRIF